MEGGALNPDAESLGWTRGRGRREHRQGRWGDCAVARRGRGCGCSAGSGACGASLTAVWVPATWAYLETFLVIMTQVWDCGRSWLLTVEANSHCLPDRRPRRGTPRPRRAFRVEAEQPRSPGRARASVAGEVAALEGGAGGRDGAVRPRERAGGDLLHPATGTPRSSGKLTGSFQTHLWPQAVRSPPLLRGSRG